MTILEACIHALKQAEKPLNSQEILSAVQAQDLYKFGAKDPRSILRGTIRKHLRRPGAHKIEEVSRDRYQAK